MQSFFTISGTIRRIESHGDCSLIMSVTDTGGGPVNLIIDSSTYVVDMENLQVGDPVLAYCDSSAPDLSVPVQPGAPRKAGGGPQL